MESTNENALEYVRKDILDVIEKKKYNIYGDNNDEYRCIIRLSRYVSAFDNERVKQTKIDELIISELYERTKAYNNVEESTIEQDALLRARAEFIGGAVGGAVFGTLGGAFFGVLSAILPGIMTMTEPESIWEPAKTWMIFGCLFGLILGTKAKDINKLFDSGFSGSYGGSLLFLLKPLQQLVIGFFALIGGAFGGGLFEGIAMVRHMSKMPFRQEIYNKYRNRIEDVIGKYDVTLDKYR